MIHITPEDIQRFEKKFNRSKKNIVVKNAVNHNSVNLVALDRKKTKKIQYIFSDRIFSKLEVTNQRSSGRCWIFAFLNYLRLLMVKKYNVDEFEFSATYLFFWDKLEKSHFFLQEILKSKKKDLSSRLVYHTLYSATNDGGQWNLLVNLIKKYGIVPKSAMRESYHSTNSKALNKILNTYLRKAACKIRDEHKGQSYIKKAMYKIYKILVIFLGEPPTKFTWKYTVNNPKNKDQPLYRVLRNVTPLDYYNKHVTFNMDDMIVLINAPCKQKPMYERYNLRHYGNVIGGMKTNYINVPIDVMISCCETSIKKKQAVWFGADVSKYLHRIEGVLDQNLFNYKSLFDFDIEIDKGNKIDYHSSMLNHAMLIKGFDKPHNEIKQWLIENSWGKNSGFKGDYMMSNDWFKDYVYEIVIHKDCVPQKVLDVLDKKPISLPPWDPFGNLLLNEREHEDDNTKE